MRVESQAADGPDSLAHEPVVVLDVVDQLPVPVVDGCELVHGATAVGRDARTLASVFLWCGRKTGQAAAVDRGLQQWDTGQEVHLYVTLRQEEGGLPPEKP